MQRREFLFSSALFAQSGQQSGQQSGPKSQVRRLNLLLVTFDQLRFDSLGCTGHPVVKTPVLDALAAEGTLFTRHYVQAPQCVPSRMSIHTGRYPHTHRTLLNSYVIPEDEPTLARLLAAAGYETVATGDRPFAPRQQLAGFERRLEAAPGRDHGSLLRKNGWSQEAIAEQQKKANSGFQMAPVPWPEELDESKHFSDLAIEFLSESSERSGKPFFLHINYRRPHHPFDPPAPYSTMYEGAAFVAPRKREGEMQNKPPGQQRAAKSVAGFDPSQMSEAELKAVQSLYWGMITLNDKHLGRVLEKVDRANTLIVFLADHGEMLGDHGLMLKGSYMYEQVLRSPLILAGPGVAKGRRVDALCEAVDVAPTIGELVGIATPHAQGKSLVPLIRGEKAQHKDAVFAEFPTVKMLRSATHKLVHYPGAKYGELYDLVADPEEYFNLYEDPKAAGHKAELYRSLSDWLIRTGDPMRAPVQDGAK